MSVAQDKPGHDRSRLGAEALDIPNISLRDHWREHLAGMAVEMAYALALLAAGGVIAWVVVTVAGSGVSP